MPKQQDFRCRFKFDFWDKNLKKIDWHFLFPKNCEFIVIVKPVAQLTTSLGNPLLSEPHKNEKFEFGFH